MEAPPVLPGTLTVLVLCTVTVLILGTGTILVPLALVLFHSVHT